MNVTKKLITDSKQKSSPTQPQIFQIQILNEKSSIKLEWRKRFCFSTSKSIGEKRIRSHCINDYDGRRKPKILNAFYSSGDLKKTDRKYWHSSLSRHIFYRVEKLREKMDEAVYHFKEQGVKNFIFGDIFLSDVKDYRESKLHPLGIEVVEPLWEKTSQ